MAAASTSSGHSDGQTPLYSVSTSPIFQSASTISDPSSVAVDAPPRAARPYRCDEAGCNEAFYSRNDLDRHRKGPHAHFRSGDKYWCCPHCSGSAATTRWPRWDNFKQHVIRKHLRQNDLERLKKAYLISYGSSRSQAITDKLDQGRLSQDSAASRGVRGIHLYTPVNDTYDIHSNTSQGELLLFPTPRISYSIKNTQPTHILPRIDISLAKLMASSSLAFPVTSPAEHKLGPPLSNTSEHAISRFPVTENAALQQLGSYFLEPFQSLHNDHTPECQLGSTDSITDMLCHFHQPVTCQSMLGERPTRRLCVSFSKVGPRNTIEFESKFTGNAKVKQADCINDQNQGNHFGSDAMCPWLSRLCEQRLTEHNQTLPQDLQNPDGSSSGSESLLFTSSSGFTYNKGGQKSRSGTNKNASGPVLQGSNAPMIPASKKRSREGTEGGMERDREERDENDDDDDGVPLPKKRVFRRTLYYACPAAKAYFYLFGNLDPFGRPWSPKMCSPRFQDIAKLKEHIREKHQRPSYCCSHCYVRFLSEAECNVHVSQTTCSPIGDPYVTQEALSMALVRKPQNENSDEFWFRLYRAWYPGLPEPSSPHHDEVTVMEVRLYEKRCPHVDNETTLEFSQGFSEYLPSQRILAAMHLLITHQILSSWQPTETGALPTLATPPQSRIITLPNETDDLGEDPSSSSVTMSTGQGTDIFSPILDFQETATNYSVPSSAPEAVANYDAQSSEEFDHSGLPLPKPSFADGTYPMTSNDDPQFSYEDLSYVPPLPELDSSEPLPD